MVFNMLVGRAPASGRALFAEVRASFYRKLFLAFVAAAIVPVLALALVSRAYMANLMLADIESEATRLATVASRVFQDLRAFVGQAAVADDLIVWLSRVVAQDVNIFDGPSLLASSERNLFASGLLPSRTPGEVYRAIFLDGRPSYVGRERAGGLEYLIAATPVQLEGREAVLTIPLASRQQETQAQIEELDRRVLLAAVLFIMLGAGIGYYMAERIADPVNRLMRATRRIARGDLDARVLATSSDELRRLVDAFNQMADDLQRQRGELERTNRLAAWADMARQVAHDIKNPLTPIQLNAEHLRRVHLDQGRPLGSVIDECVGEHPRPGAAAAADLVGVLELRDVARAAAGRDAVSPTWSRKSSSRIEPGSPDASKIETHVPPNAAARQRRSHADRPRADQHHRERAARDARRRHADDRCRAGARSAWCSCASPTPASAWTPRRSRRSSSRTSRRRRLAPAWD